MATRTATKKPEKKKAAVNQPAAKPLTQAQLKLKTAIEEATFLSLHEKNNYLRWLAGGQLKEAPTLDDYAIKKYPPATYDCAAYESVYDANRGKFLPFQVGDIELYEMLDTLTYACESGKLNSRTWVKQVFHSEEALEWFLEELSCYDQCFRIHDRWWQTLAMLCEHQDVEEGFVTCEELADSLREHIEETNQAF